MGSKRLKKNLQFIWIIGLIAAINICRNLLWLMPSALMKPIMEDTGFSHTQVGQMSLVVTVMMGVFLIGGSYVLEPLGIRKALFIGMLCIAGDGLFSFIQGQYAAIMAGKVFCGIGYGLTTCAITALIASSFPQKQIGMINGINACITSLSISLSYQIIVPVFTRLNSWRLEAILWSICSCIVAALVLLLVPNKERNNSTESCRYLQTNNLAAAWQFQIIQNFVLMIGSLLLLYVSINSYYPNYLHQVLDFPLAVASSMTGLIAISGVAGSMLMGFAVSRLKHPKKAILVLFVVLSLSFLGMTMLQANIGLTCAICGFGASYFAINSLCVTCVMRIPGITPFVASAGISMMSACGSLLALIIPTVQQFLTAQLGAQTAFLLLGSLLLPALWGALLQRNLPTLS